MSRKFVYDNRQFPDPDPSLSVEDVRRQMAEHFPELANAETREEKRGEDVIYTFSKRIGTKGRRQTGSGPDGPRDRLRAWDNAGAVSRAVMKVARHLDALARFEWDGEDMLPDDRMWSELRAR